MMRLLKKEGRVQIRPKIQAQKSTRDIPSEEIPEVVNWNMTKTNKDTGKFYVHLFQGLYGGKIMRDGEVHHNEVPLYGRVNVASFKPDIVIPNGTGEMQVEVKSYATHKGSPTFGAHQFSSYTRSFLENPYSKVVVGIFKYGKGNSPQKLYLCDYHGKREAPDHKCDSRCVIRKLSSTTRNLLVVPHNLLSFLLSVAYVDGRDQASTKSIRDREDYFLPLGRWMSWLHKHQEEPLLAIGKILEDKGKRIGQKRTFGMLPKPKDFLLEDLVAERQESPTNIFCGSYKVRGYDGSSFPITVYTNPRVDDWREKIGGHLDSYLMNVGIYDVWYKQEERIARLQEQKQIERDERPIEDGEELPELEIDDDIPF